MKKFDVFNGANPNKKFMLHDLQPGEVFSEEYVSYILDSENFHFDKIDARESRINRVAIQKFLDAYNIDVSLDDFIILWNFQNYVNSVYPEYNKYRAFREDIFRISGFNSSHPMPLSVAFDRKIAQCVEVALLAQMYLQHKGIDCVLCCGNAFLENNPHIMFGGGAHAYLMVTLGGKKYFYDPVNPMGHQDNKIPAIMSFDKISEKDRADFNSRLRSSVAQSGRFAYVEVSDIYGAGRHWLYGFESDDDENGVWRRRSPDGIKRPMGTESFQNMSGGRAL